MNPYLKLFRIVNALFGIIGVVIASFMAVGIDIGDYIVNIVIVSFVVVFFICGGNALNDYIDYEIDKTAHPDRPIPSGKLTRKQALNAGLIMFICSVVLSFLTRDIWCISIVIVACIMMIAYECGLKQRGFIGNVVIAVLTGMVFLLGGAATGAPLANGIVALMAALVSVGREIAKDIEDMESDEGRKTLPMSIGVRNAAIISSIFFILGPILSIIPYIQNVFGPLYLLVIVADLIFVYCAIMVYKDPRTAEKKAKLAMFVALLSFILGLFKF